MVNMCINRQESAKSGLMSILLGIGIGMVVGGIVALLYTPASGRENRMMIKDRALRAKDEIIWHARAEAQAVDQKYSKQKK
jgi:gas vesicle protein